MRLNYPVLLTSCFVLAAAPLSTQAQSGAVSPSDGSEAFLNAYSSFQKAESLEKRGDAAAALNLYQEVGKALGQISAQYPAWSPQVVKYRSQLTTQAIQRLQATRQPSAPAAQPRPRPTASAESPSSSSIIPQLPEREGVPVAPQDPFAEIQGRLTQLQNQLQDALDDARRLRKEKSALLKNLEDTADSASKALEDNMKARSKAEEVAKILEQRADVAERALLIAREDKSKSGGELSALERERDQLRQQRKELQAEQDAAEEVRRRLEARLAQTQAREVTATGERDTAVEQAGLSRKQLEQMQGELARVVKARNTLQEQFEKASTERDTARGAALVAERERDEFKAAAERASKESEAAKSALAKVTRERDDALAVATRLKDARAQIEKLEAENAESAAKLARVQKQLETQRLEGTQTPQSAKSMGDEVDGIRTRLVEALKRADSAEQSVSELEGKLSAAVRDAASFKGEATQAIADKEKEHEERNLLQGILNRSLQEQSRRDKARKDLVAEVSRLKVSSDALIKQIGLLGEPVLQLSDKEQALFKQPLVEISDEGISISAIKTSNKASGSNAASSESAKTSSGADSKSASTQTARTDSAASPTAGAGAAKSGAKTTPLPDEVRVKISEAKDRFDKNDFSVAEKLYKEVLDAAPGNAFVLSNLGVTQFRAKRYPEAESSLRKALELAPEDAFSRSTLGIVYYTQGKLDKAVEELTQSVAINPSNAIAHNYLGIAASRKGWQENARKELEAAAELDPSYADAYFNLAVVCASQKPPDKEAARNAYHKATALGAAPDTRLEDLIR
jgi:Flp pilus assembly protein TadD